MENKKHEKKNINNLDHYYLYISHKGSNDYGPVPYGFQKWKQTNNREFHIQYTCYII